MICITAQISKPRVSTSITPITTPPFREQELTAYRFWYAHRFYFIIYVEFCQLFKTDTLFCCFNNKIRLIEEQTRFQSFSLKTGLSLFIRISKRLNIAKSGYRIHPYEFQTICVAKITTITH